MWSATKRAKLLTFRQQELLHLLAQRQHWTIGEFAKACGTSSAAATKNINRLEKRGMVTRTRSFPDKRKVQVHLTPDAITIITKLAS